MTSIPAAAEKLPEFTGDKSGIGVHYVDAYLKPMNVKLADGTPVQMQTARLEDRPLRGTPRKAKA